MNYLDFLAQNKLQNERGIEGVSSSEEAYNKYLMGQEPIRQVYDQYQQYQNRAFNDYYTGAKPGTSDFDRYNPYILRPQTMDIRHSYQDALGRFVAPRQMQMPGLDFNNWYNTVYNKPDYQQLQNVDRMKVDWMAGMSPENQRIFGFQPKINYPGRDFGPSDLSLPGPGLIGSPSGGVPPSAPLQAIPTNTFAALNANPRFT